MHESSEITVFSKGLFNWIDLYKHKLFNAFDMNIYIYTHRNNVGFFGAKLIK